MSRTRPSSRSRFRSYREKIASRSHAERAVGPAAQRSRSLSALLAALWQQLRGHHSMLIGALLVLSCGTSLGLVPLYGTKIVFDSVLATQPLPAAIPDWLPVPETREGLLAAVAIAMVVLALAAIVVNTWSRWQTTRISKQVVVGVRRRVFEHAIRLPLNRVYEIKSGGIASVLREDVNGIGELIFSMLYNPCRAVVQLVLSLIVLAWVDWRLLLGALCLLPLVWLTHRTWIGRLRPLWRDIRKTRQQVDGKATEAFAGMRIVRAFARERTEATQFGNDQHLMARQEILAWWWARGVDAAWAALIPIATAALLGYGGARVLADERAVAAGTLTLAEALTVGDLVMFLAYLTALLDPIAALAYSATRLQTNLAGLDRTLDLLAEDPELPAPTDPLPLAARTVRGRVTLEGVEFSYPGRDDPVIRDVSIDVHPGQTVALVGPSGAGKTTLCNLIARFHDPQRGRVLLDGVDIRRYDVSHYRQLLAIVEQDTIVFDGTVRENIAYGRRGADFDAIEAAAIRAGAHDFITGLPNGYDTLIGERGAKLSGGQRQRVSIARAILADPRILILDEATSHLDAENERIVQHGLGELLRDRTGFVIAHRLSTIRSADRIFVIEDGRILAHGTHDDLLMTNEHYRMLVELQTTPAVEPA